MDQILWLRRYLNALLAIKNHSVAKYQGIINICIHYCFRVWGDILIDYCCDYPYTYFFIFVPIDDCDKNATLMRSIRNFNNI